MPIITYILHDCNSLLALYKASADSVVYKKAYINVTVDNKGVQ